MDKKQFINLMECILLIHDKTPDDELLLKLGFSMKEILKAKEVLKEMSK
ncbi:MAG: hypothetical protein WC346_04480 [Methanogenium sp.]|jgi:hypothetical protein